MGDLTSDGEWIGTARLVRLLTAIGMPAAPAVMVRRTLTEIAEVLRSDVVGLVERVGDRLRLTEAVGVDAAADSFTKGWPVGPPAEVVIETATPIAINRLGTPDTPHTMLERIGCSAAWIPLGSQESTADILLVMRDAPTAFTPDDVQ